MSNFVTVDIMFRAIISVDDEKKLEDLIFQETDWIGEPKTNTGCVVNIIPKKFKVSGREEIIEPDPSTIPDKAPVVPESPKPSSNIPVVKGFKIDDGKMIKDEAKILGALKMQAGVTLVLSTEKGIRFESIEKMLGEEVSVMHTGGNTGAIVKVGES